MRFIDNETCRGKPLRVLILDTARLRRLIAYLLIE